MKRRARAVVCVALSALTMRVARAEDAVVALDPERYEYAGAPIIGGNSDIGVLFGGAGTITRFHGQNHPYLWRIELVLSASVKSDGSGTRLVHHSDIVRFDLPQLWGGRLRLDVRSSFQRTINAGYFGLGNAADATRDGSAENARRYQAQLTEGRVRSIARIRTGTPVEVGVGAIARYEAPEVYAGSKLAEDSAAHTSGNPRVRGTTAGATGSLAAGLILDTRDNEFVTTRGVFYQAGVGGTLGTMERIAFGNAAAVLTHYARIPGPFLFASRFVASFEVGRVPFYDLQQGGVFDPQYMLGGESGVRGVPQGRYGGLVKTVANFEIRSTLPRFTIFKQSLRFGTTTFFDAGRAWSDYTFDRARDGGKLGLKYGVGGGVFVQWGEAAIFRLEAAYSPDAISENPSFPVGIYIGDGLMF